MDATETILIVDDKPVNLLVLERALKDDSRKIIKAESGEQAIELARRHRPMLVLLDVVMDGIDGFETCRVLKSSEETRDASILFLSALEETDDKVRGFKLGAVDFISKPFQIYEVKARVETHLTINRLKKAVEARNRRLEHELSVAQTLIEDADRSQRGPLLGESRAVARLREDIAELAQRHEPVLLTGPPGSGQAAVALALHRESDRRGRAFITVDAARLALAPDELFPMDPAARGKYRLASGGTLFIDRVHELDARSQETLQKLMAEAQQERLEGRRPALDVRVVATASERLEQRLEDGQFSRRLYKQLSKRKIRLPSLNERSKDIPTLARHFLDEYAPKLGKSFTGISESSVDRLVGYHWPGNIDELRNLVERAAVLSRGPILDIDESLLHQGGSVGSYQLMAKLGEGGMGEVWRAEHKLLARAAAVKVIHSRQLDGAEERSIIVQRFEREARATAALESRNTVELYDFGVSQSGDFYYVMELLRGMDLSDMVEEHGPLPPGRAVRLLIQACRSLAEAHDAGLIHRDIKPANLFVARMADEYDILKVLDFGVVKGPLGSSERQLTAEQNLVGTPSYIAPEYATQNGETIDGRADLYSLGCVAYWLLSGRLVFESSTAMGAVIAHATLKPTPLSEAAHQAIPPALEEIVMRLLSKSPRQRPSDATELRRDLMAVLEELEPWTEDDAERWWRQLELRRDLFAADQSDPAAEKVDPRGPTDELPRPS